MLKTFFWLLLLANLVLFGLNRGASDASEAGREPARLATQLHPERIRLRHEGAAAPASGAEAPGKGQPSAAAAPQSPPQSAAVAPQPAAPQPAPQLPSPLAGSTVPSPGEGASLQGGATATPPSAASPAQPQAMACMEAGEFGPAEAGRFETQLAVLELGSRVTRQQVRAISSYIVFIPSQGSAEAAASKAAELQSLGVTDYFVIRDGTLQWGISLGIFNNEPSARSHLAMLQQRGVQSARIAARRTVVNRFVFQIRDLDPALRARIEGLKPQFPGQQFRACTPAQPDPLVIAKKQG